MTSTGGGGDATLKKAVYDWSDSSGESYSTRVLWRIRLCSARKYGDTFGSIQQRPQDEIKSWTLGRTLGYATFVCDDESADRAAVAFSESLDENKHLSRHHLRSPQSHRGSAGA
jgi:hypothetical protein